MCWVKNVTGSEILAVSAHAQQKVECEFDNLNCIFASQYQGNSLFIGLIK